MDQLASLEGRAGHALLLDCQTLTRELVPLQLLAGDATLLVIDTTVAHGTGGGGYRARREECAEGARRLGVGTLRQASLEEVGARLSGTLQRRARHVVTENDRVVRAVASLRGGDLQAVGEQLSTSHASFRDDYQVSCAELDLAVDVAIEAGAWGARMTGAGFGGCAIAWCRRKAATRSLPPCTTPSLLKPCRPQCFEVVTADGARRLV